MERAQARAFAIDLPGELRWEWFFLALVGTLASTVTLKFAEIQYLEYIYAFQMGLLVLALPRRHYRVSWARPLAFLGLLYILFDVLALVLAIFALRFHFYTSSWVTPLKSPVIITISRLVELILSSFIMLYLADLFRTSVDKLRFTMRIYFWTGVASACYSTLGAIALRLGLGSFGVYSNLNRFRGFYNEGGPYGLYVVSCLVVGICLYRQQWEPRRRFFFAFAMLSIGLVFSFSKAAYLCSLTLLLLNALLEGSVARRLGIVLTGIALIFTVTRFIDVEAGIRIYQREGANYEFASHRHSLDQNYVGGRVAGAFIIPRMIAAHPWTGVGWGNYALVRNDPAYRGSAAWADFYDIAGLGILSYAAEFGLPLFFFLVVIFLLPFVYLRRHGAPAYIWNLALVHPLVMLYGAQLNLTYPWIATAFALGLGFAARRRKWQAIGAAVPSSRFRLRLS
jgi:hypothetical protein